MKLKNVDFYVDYPNSLKVKNLRIFILEKLIIKGEIIRWSIIEIKESVGKFNIKKLRIKAVVAN